MMFQLCAAILAVFVLIPSPAQAVPIWIQEVFYDATGPDSAHAFTELAGEPGTNLDEWSLVGVNGSTGLPYRVIELRGVMPDDGVFVIATSAANPDLAAVRDFVASVDWQNGPDAVQLWWASEVIMDAVQYGDAGEANAGEGNPAEDVVGLSLTRDEAGTDTDDNAVDFRAASPTPGVAGARPMPSPPLISLVFLGTAFLLARRRS